MNRKKRTPNESTTGAGPENGTAAPTGVSAKQKPEVFRYHNYLDYLRDWIQYQKSARKGFSLRKIAKEYGFATGYLPMVLAGQRPLSVEGLRKLLPALALTQRERHFFESMHALGTTSSAGERAESLRHMKSFQRFRDNNPDEAEVYEYLTNWYYFTIRELSADPEFKLDPLWIQERLRVHVPVKDIQTAIDFLVRHQYIEINDRGHVAPPSKHLQCAGGIYRVALGQYHKQLFQLAEKSIENAASSERNILGHTFAIPVSRFDEVRALVDQTIAKVQEIAKASGNEARDSVYHLEMALFPLTKNKSGGPE